MADLTSFSYFHLKNTYTRVFSQETEAHTYSYMNFVLNDFQSFGSSQEHAWPNVTSEKKI